MFENHRKSLILHCERSELRLHFSLKNAILASFRKTEVCGQTVLPDKSIFKGQNLAGNAENSNWNATFWVIFKHCANNE